MSIGPMGGLPGSAAGSPLSQTRGAETERQSLDEAQQQRVVDSNQEAEDAAGIGQTSEDQEASDRDADGRRLWEANAKSQSEEPTDTDATATRQSQDTSGESGNRLDLTG